VPFLVLNSSFALVIESRWLLVLSLSHVEVISSYEPHGQIMSAICIALNTSVLQTVVRLCL
jgi:hypothetical protein